MMSYANELDALTINFTKNIFLKKNNYEKNTKNNKAFFYLLVPNRS